MTDRLVARLRDEIELLQEQVRQLREALVDERALVSLEYRLTPTEERVYRHLLARRMVTYDSIFAVLYGEASEPPLSNTTGVFICKIRAKLKPHGIEIINHRGRGYSLKGRYTEDNDGVAV